MGGLATYDMFSQYQELVGRMFGGFIEFTGMLVQKNLHCCNDQDQMKHLC